jgi:LPXTG-motif cell wall-anchored protein
MPRTADPTMLVALGGLAALTAGLSLPRRRRS